MFQTSNAQTIIIFPLLMGGLAILIAVFYRQLMRFIRIKPLYDVYTNPRLQRSARITENLVRLFFVLFGLGFLVDGIGPRFLPGEATYIASMVLIGLAGLVTLAAIVVVLANWKPK